MDADDILLEAEDRMDKAVKHLEGELRKVRTGRANPGLVEHLGVEVYGTSQRLKQVATIACPEPQQILIRPFDPGTLKDIERALQKSDLGLPPSSDGKVIRLTIPPMTGERRQQLLGQVKKFAEEAKVSIRTVRRDANKALDGLKGSISEDDIKTHKDTIENETKKYSARIDDRIKTKTPEILEG